MHMAMPIGKLFQEVSYCRELQNFQLFNFIRNLPFPKVSLQKMTGRKLLVNSIQKMHGVQGIRVKHIDFP